jgi:hypothetical protein
VAELANASVIYPRDLSSKLGTDRKIFSFVCVAFEFKPVGYLTLEHYLLICKYFAQ